MLAHSSRLLVILVFLTSPSVSAAQGTSENAEARVYFEEGNRLYKQASRASGSQRIKLLRRSLEAYVDSLRIVRSRNALFNAAIVLEELGRNDESFNYYTEYLRVEGLTVPERNEASGRRDALRPKVAVLRVSSDPEEALLWVDRKDLAPRGETPIEVALPTGEHRVFIEKEGYSGIESTLKIVRGQTESLELTLVPLPVEPIEPIEPEVPLSVAEVDKPRPRLRNAAIGTTASTVVTASVALGLSIRARTLRDEHDRAAEEYQLTGDLDALQRAEDLADKTDRFNIAADVFWGTTIALGVSAIVLYAMHRKRERRDKPEVGVSVSQHGGFASVRLPLGATR